MVTFVFVLSTQMWSTKMRSSKFITKSNAQKQMARFGFGCKFHDLNYFELDYLQILWNHYTLEVIIKTFM